MRRKLRGEETEVRIPQGHVLTNLMKMWQYWDRKMWPPGIEPRVSGTAHGAAQCDTTTPQPLVFFSISMWVNLSLACPGRLILQTPNTSNTSDFADVGRHNFAEPDVNVLVGTSLMSEDATALIPIALVNDHHFWALAPAEEQPSACLALNMERFEGNPLKMSVADGRDELEDEDLEPAS